MCGLAPHCRIVTVIDGHPATLAWLGSVQGHQTIPLGVEHFGQTGTISDLYRHYGIDTDGIVEKVNHVLVKKRRLILCKRTKSATRRS